MDASFDSHLDPSGLALVQSLSTPFDIQAFLDSVPYSPENVDRCPLEVLHDRKAHCLDGALFAAAMLRRQGHPPIVVDLVPEPGTDDDHVLAIYRQFGLYGAIAKSNYVGLRFREPVYRNLRELVMSYFEQYFNVTGHKTLRAYTRPINLARFDSFQWMVCSDHLAEIEHYFGQVKCYPVISSESVRRLSPVDKRSLESGLAGSNPEGLYKPRRM